MTTKRSCGWLTRARLPAQVLFALLLMVPAAAASPPEEPSLESEGTLKVMTYNMYVGAGYVGVTDPDYPDFLQAITNLILDTTASDPTARAQAIARQIAAVRPHLVSLQEVATWSIGPSPDNLTLEFDFLQLLLQALSDQGAQYTPVGTLTHFNVTMPSTLGYVGNTWRVVVLARAGLKPEDFSFTNVQAAPWSAPCTWVVPIPALGIWLPFPRGWVSTDVSYRGKQFGFIAAHLDSRSTSKNICQGLELLNGPANTALPVIVAADLNCDLSNPSDPKYPTCVNFLNAGFTDAWSAANPFEPGYTKDLPVMTMRGDYVMARGRFKAQAAALLGEEYPADMATPSLWPSNHCGVAARLQHPGEE